MSQILEATFDGQVFRPVQAVELEPDTQVEIVVTVKTAKLKGPKDFSSRIDDYLYGGAKLDDE
ncbi:MAG TPA: DUF104 domain-containing protein [Pyrinomonadaceae bacterium]|nr:DUF104 domain-containing protein [Pyrinomonadaceae bacterium]